MVSIGSNSKFPPVLGAGTLEIGLLELLGNVSIVLQAGSTLHVYGLNGIFVLSQGSLGNDVSGGGLLRFGGSASPAQRQAQQASSLEGSGPFVINSNARFEDAVTFKAPTTLGAAVSFSGNAEFQNAVSCRADAGGIIFIGAELRLSSSANFDFCRQIGSQGGTLRYSSNLLNNLPPDTVLPLGTSLNIIVSSRARLLFQWPLSVLSVAIESNGTMVLGGFSGARIFAKTFRFDSNANIDVCGTCSSRISYVDFSSGVAGATLIPFDGSRVFLRSGNVP